MVSVTERKGKQFTRDEDKAGERALEVMIDDGKESAVGIAVQNPGGFK